MHPRNELLEAVDCSCFAVRRAARMITQHYDRHLRPTGLRATQLTTLVLLSVAGPLPLTALAERLGTERTTVTRNLRLLLSRGFVTERDSDDRRVRTLAVTARGTAAARAALPRWRKAQSALAQHLGATAIQGLQLTANGATRLATPHTRGTRGRQKEE